MAAFLAAAALTACEKAAHTPEPEGEPRQVEYGMTRAGGTVPADGTAYTFVSYNRNSDGTYGPNTSVGNASYPQKPVGRYAYLADPQYKGILQPCEVDDAVGTATGIPYSYNGRAPQKGQSLYDGDFRTVCLWPALPVVSAPGGSHRVLFNRADEFYASEPFDMRVDGYEIFELDLDDNGNRPLAEVRSKIVVDFVQGTASPFTIRDLRLMNPGVWGWYQPLLRHTDISYDAGDAENIYERGVNETPGNEIDASAMITATGLTGKGKTVYTTGDGVDDGFFFFSCDYQLDVLPQPGLAFLLDMNGSSFKITVPTNITMQRGQAYRFRLTVESVVIRATFEVVDWDTGEPVTDPDLGGSQEQILGTWTPDGWIPHASGGDIGTPNP